jgi:outer membrane biosynthesis protein TonB
MAARSTTGEETIGLILAAALHAAVLAALLFTRHAPPPKLPERIVVSLSNDVAMTSTSPHPAARAAPDLAPTLGEAPPAPAEPEPVPAPPIPVREEAPPPPPPRPVARPQPQPKITPPPAKAPPAPRPAPHKQAAPAEPAQHAEPTPQKKPAGGHRIGADFLKGLGADAAGTSHDAPASAADPGVKASLASAVSRQIKPNWSGPDGIDVDKLATTIEWDLKPDGTLAGPPRFVAQTGVTGSNRAQAQRHIEQAMRAVRLSAPYLLPPKYYASWRRVKFTFDWKLGQ